MSKLSEIRTAISAKSEDLAAVEQAGAPADAIAAGLQSSLEMLCERYDLAIDNLAKECLTEQQPGTLSVRRAFGLNLETVAIDFLAAALLRHCGPAIRQDLQAAIERQAPGLPKPLSAVQRARNGAKLRAELRALQREEEAEILAELVRGNEIERRADADPAAILGIPDAVLEEFGL